jgi:hypothetical protein
MTAQLVQFALRACSRWRLVTAGALAICLSAELALAAPPKRARPPKFPKAVTDVFFPDALEKLEGKRPDTPSPANAPVPPPTPGARSPATGEGSSNWSKLIDAEVIEDEIKAQQRKLGESVQNPVKFKAGDYKLARDQLSLLAALFAIDAEYGQTIRWRREAAGVRDLLARAGFNCKVGSDASYAEAKARHDDLAMLIRGERIETPKRAAEMGWEKIADRSPLMKRLEQAHDGALAPLTANASQFAANLDKLSHEAQLVAALADLIAREGYEYADDATFRGHAQSLQAQASGLRAAVVAKNFEQARQVVGEINKACTNCHEDYRN